MSSAPSTDQTLRPSGPVWLDWFYGFLGWVAGAILAGMAISVFLGVVLRWTGSQGIEGLNEVPNYLFVWVVAIGGAAAMHKHEHTVLDYFVNLFGLKGRAFMMVVVNLLTIFLFAYIIWLGFRLLPTSSYQTSPGLGLNMYWRDISIPIGAVLIMIPMIRNLIWAIGALWRKPS